MGGMFSITALISTILPLADGFDGHHDWGDGWWVVMVVAMVVFWALVIGAGIWLVRELISHRRSDSGGGGEPPALAVLDRRLAEGAISIEEYKERRRVLLDPGGVRGEGDGG